MDKSTLSNYGWIVIAVLVLSVMIALSTPFGTYIKDAVLSTTDGLINTNQLALETAISTNNAANNPTNNIIPMPLTISSKSVQDGDILQLEENCVKKNKQLTFTGTIETMDTLIFRHGKNVYGSAYVVIDNTKVEVYDYTTKATLKLSQEHGLNIIGDVKITMVSNNADGLTITITTESGTFTPTRASWAGGCHGMIEMESVGSQLSNVTLAWNCDDYEKDIWVFGDSYLGMSNKSRWPYYILSSGYDNCLYSGYPGSKSESMYNDWKNALTHGTPKYAVWCLGMNNEDPDDGINVSWKECVDLFIADCNERGIIPILTTIPNTPTMNNIYKNEYVRNSGYRYIDFASAVGATEANSSWFDGMLSSDNVHPSNTGAQALAQQVLKDFPEIKG